MKTLRKLPMTTVVADKFAEPPDGPSPRALSTMAKAHQLWIIAGLSTRQEGRYLNSALAFAPNRSLVATYDKQRLFGYAKETMVYSAGTNLCDPSGRTVARSLRVL